MNTLIQEKDLILSFLCEKGSYINIAKLTYAEFPVNGREKIVGIMQHFQRLNLIDNYSFNVYGVSFRLLFEASEFLSKGGFKSQEELLQANIQKLLLEIEDLKPSLPQKVEVITSIASGITTALGFIFGK